MLHGVKLKKAELKPTHPTNVAADEDEVIVRFGGTQHGTYLTTQDRVNPMMRVMVTCDTVNRTCVSWFQCRLGLNALG